MLSAFFVVIYITLSPHLHMTIVPSTFLFINAIFCHSTYRKGWFWTKQFVCLRSLLATLHIITSDSLMYWQCFVKPHCIFDASKINENFLGASYIFFDQSKMIFMINNSNPLNSTAFWTRHLNLAMCQKYYYDPNGLPYTIGAIVTLWDLILFRK